MKTIIGFPTWCSPIKIGSPGSGRRRHGRLTEFLAPSCLYKRVTDFRQSLLISIDGAGLNGLESTVAQQTGFNNDTCCSATVVAPSVQRVDEKTFWNYFEALVYYTSLALGCCISVLRFVDIGCWDCIWDICSFDDAKLVCSIINVSRRLSPHLCVVYEDLLADKVPGGRSEALGAEKLKYILQQHHRCFCCHIKLTRFIKLAHFPNFKCYWLHQFFTW